MTSLLPVVELSFAPIVTIGGMSVRLETLALAAALLAALLVAALMARRTPVDLSLSPGAPSADPDEGPNHLRADDLLYIAVAAMPGAVAGGRLGYWLVHRDFYAANPGALLDLGQGGLQLSLGVVGAIVTGVIVAGMLGAPIGRWLHALALPVLLALAGGKAATILGGGGQGAPWDGGWATAYLGDGPWGSLAPALPSYPSQAMEAAATAGVLVLVWALLFLGVFERRTGAAFWLGIGLWASARTLVATTWRDPVVAGPFRTDQAISLAIAGLAFVAVAILAVVDLRRRRREAEPEEAAPPPEPQWPVFPG